MADPIGYYEVEADGEWIELPVFEPDAVETPLEVWTGNEWGALALTDPGEATTPLEVWSGSEWLGIGEPVELGWLVEDWEDIDAFDGWRYDEDEDFTQTTGVPGGEAERTTRASFPEAGTYGMKVGGADFFGTMVGDGATEYFPVNGETWTMPFRVRPRENYPLEVDETAMFEFPICTQSMFDDGRADGNREDDFDTGYTVRIWPETSEPGWDIDASEYYSGFQVEHDDDFTTAMEYNHWHRLRVYYPLDLGHEETRIVECYIDKYNGVGWTNVAHVRFNSDLIDEDRFYHTGGIGVIGHEAYELHVDDIRIIESLTREEDGSLA